MTEKEILDCIPKVFDESPGDYVEDGLVYCGSCRTQKQIRLNIAGVECIYPCLCVCRLAARDAEEARQKEKDRINRINDLRVNGISDKATRSMTFDTAMETPAIVRARNYAKKWDDMKKKNVGLLLFGGTGTGKTFTAACIANAVIDKGSPALVTSFPRILNALQTMGGEDRVSYIDSFDQFPLLVIDDLGAERQSQYALEIVYSVIDNRYKAKKPIILTTNISLSDMQNENRLEYKRIYDRVLEMCIPLKVDGESMRKRAAAEKMRAAAEMLKEE